MKKRTAHLILAIAVMLTSTACAESPPLLVISPWGGATASCVPAFRPTGMNEKDCADEMRVNYNRFIGELKTQFAASPECAGITVSSFDPNNPPPDPNWLFSIDYVSDIIYIDNAQRWLILPPKGSNLPGMQATGRPSQIAKQVCTIIKGKGAAVSE